MGSQKDSESPHSSISGLPNPKCRGKRQRISFHFFSGKSRAKQAPFQQPLTPPLDAAPAGLGSVLSISENVLHPLYIETPTDLAVLGSQNTLDSSEGLENATCSEDMLECPLCLIRQPQEKVPEIMTCSHRSCLACLRQYLRIEITESRVNISCPECSERLNPHDIRLILDDPVLMDKYELFMLRRYLASDPDCRWCPAPDCGFAVIAYGCASCPKLTCGRQGCETEFCYHCKQVWHPNQTCDTARQQRANSMRVRTKHTSGLSYGQESATDDIKPCPRCGAYIIKMNDGSCNHMTCAVCGCEFCWLCMKEISDLHYLSPSGCTFWGKKPWSRKKKILWQLGTLIGAPVGITLIAGIAVPAMIIGIPVYIGRKIHSRYDGKKTSKHKRNLAITGGVALSVVASPVIAAVSVVADAWRALKNPSLGESSIEGLTSGLSTSGSPTDGLSMAQGGYGETGSFTALSGGTLGTNKGKYRRLEVQADFQKETFHKDTVSLSTISDNASTRAMAGSIISSYNPHERFYLKDIFAFLFRDCTNLEIQVDIETKPSHLRLASGSSIEDLTQTRPLLAMALNAGFELGDAGSAGGMDHGKECSIHQPGDVTLAQPESIRSDLETSDTQSDDIPDLTSDECDVTYPRACWNTLPRAPKMCTPTLDCHSLHNSENSILYR
ncbi:RN19B ligase, partial [Polypterus senegalus]